MRMHNKSSLFLMEMIVAILFFSVAAAVCVQLFVKSHLLNDESQQKAQAATAASAIAEAYRADMLDDYYDISQDNDIWFDSNWDECDKADARFCASLTLSGDQTMTIKITDQDNKDNEVLSLDVTRLARIQAAETEDDDA